MAIFRINSKKSNYSIIANQALQDTSLSWKAKGLLAYLLSLPDNWEINISHLVNQSPDGKTLISSAINELIKAGYILRRQVRDAAGKLRGYEYNIYETPKLDKPATENPTSDNPATEIQTLINTNDTNNEINKELTAAKNFAAAFNSNNAQKHIDSKITNELTDQQKQHITQKLQRSLNLELSPAQFQEYQEGIEAELLNPKSFSQAGNDFHKKLNTICRQIVLGKWQVPVALKEKKVAKQNNQLNELNTAINNLSAEQAQIDRLLNFCMDAGQRADLEQQRERCNTQIGELRSALIVLQQNNNQAA